jgi:hypothetical protein
LKLIDRGGIRIRFRTLRQNALGYEKVAERLRRAEETALAKSAISRSGRPGDLRAASDTQNRLSYSVSTKAFAMLNRLLCASAWKTLIQATITYEQS